jgi:MoxR-like ATPase
MKADQPAMIWGAPGVGKTDLLMELAKTHKGGNLIDFRLAMRDPTSVTGYHIPDVKNKVMTFLKDEELPTKGSGILFMDEIVSALPATQAAGMQLTLTGKSGSYTKPPGWYICAAGNRLTDQAIVHKMPSALSYRFTHFDLEPNLDDWIEWALKNDIQGVVISFLRYRKNLFYEENYSLRAAPNPRAWARISKFLDSGTSENTLLGISQGAVGDAAGIEFYAFYKTWANLPSIDSIMMSPDTVPVPAGVDILYATSGAIASELSATNIPRLMPYIRRLPMEFQVLTIRDAFKHKAKIETSKDYQKWVFDNQAVLK